MAPIPAPQTTLHTERVSQYVSLPPAALNAPLPALCANVFSPLLLSYFPPARGIVLSYSDVSLSSSPPSKNQDNAEDEDGGQVMLRHVDEYSTPYLWARATFVVFRPVRNAQIAARITHQSKTHLTLSYLNVFPVSVLAAQLPSAWTFDAASGEAGEGAWMNEEGNPVEGELSVRLLDFDARTDGKARGKGVRLEGSLISEEVEAEGRREKGKGKKEGKKKGILKA